jgi:hypothetical protein
VEINRTAGFSLECAIYHLMSRRGHRKDPFSFVDVAVERARVRRNVQLLHTGPAIRASHQLRRWWQVNLAFAVTQLALSRMLAASHPICFVLSCPDSLALLALT